MALTTMSRSAPTATTGVARRPTISPAWRHIDVLLVAATAGISVLGVLMIYSATRNALAVAGLNPQTDMRKEAVFAVIGFAAMAATAFFDYKRYLAWAPALYVGSLLAAACDPGHRPQDAGSGVVDPGRQLSDRAVRAGKGHPGTVPRRPACQPQGHRVRAGAAGGARPVGGAFPAHIPAGRPRERPGAGGRDGRDAPPRRHQGPPHAGARHSSRPSVSAPSSSSACSSSTKRTASTLS